MSASCLTKRKKRRTFAKFSSFPLVVVSALLIGALHSVSISSAHVNTATFAAVAFLIVPVCGREGRFDLSMWMQEGREKNTHLRSPSRIPSL